MGQDVKVGEFLHSKMVQASFHPDLATALGPHRGPKMVMSTVGQSLPLHLSTRLYLLYLRLFCVVLF